MKKWDEMTPRERDALVADKVMSWSVEYTYYVKSDDTNFMVGHLVDEWSPSTHISTAWEVVEKFDGHEISKYSSNGKRRVIVYNNDGSRGEALGQIGQPLAETACIAALRAVGIEV